MKKQLFTAALGLLAIALIINGCSKSSSSTPAKTNTDLLAQGNWKIKTVFVNNVDYTSSVPSCVKDNIVTFMANGTGNWDEGPTKCNSTDPQTNPFTWAWQSNGTILHISTPLFTGGSGDFTLVSLNDTQLVVSQNVTISGTSQPAVITFIH
jgi:hypothetical protein